MDTVRKLSTIHIIEYPGLITSTSSKNSYSVGQRPALIQFDIIIRIMIQHLIKRINFYEIIIKAPKLVLLYIILLRSLDMSLLVA